jgi:hypothetical protein
MASAKRPVGRKSINVRLPERVDAEITAQSKNLQINKAQTIELYLTKFCTYKNEGKVSIEDIKHIKKTSTVIRAELIDKGFVKYNIGITKQVLIPAILDWILKQ